MRFRLLHISRVSFHTRFGLLNLSQPLKDAPEWVLDEQAGTLTNGIETHQAPEGQEQVWCEAVLSALQGMCYRVPMTHAEIKARAIEVLGFQGRKRLNPQEHGELMKWLRNNARLRKPVKIFSLL